MNERPLEPCPFCGGRAKRELVRLSRRPYRGERVAVECEDCWAQGPPEDTEVEARLAWNNPMHPRERKKP